MTAPGPRRPGVVYGIRTHDPATGSTVLGYVGQTFQPLPAREAQHRAEQPWSDLIVDVFVIARGRWTTAEIDAVEADRIRVLRPVYNHDHNLNNSGRVPIWLARRQRAERDRVAGRARWVPPQPGVLARWRPTWTRRLVVWSAVTVVLFAPASSPGWLAVRDVAAAVLLVPVVALARRAPRRRGRRR